VYLHSREQIIKPAAALLSIVTYIFAVRIKRLFMYTMNLCLFDLCYSNKIQIAANCRKNISPNYSKNSGNIFHYKKIQWKLRSQLHNDTYVNIRLTFILQSRLQILRNGCVRHNKENMESLNVLGRDLNKANQNLFSSRSSSDFDPEWNCNY
jgi:hypothetical protein